MITREGIETDPEKVIVVKQWQTPENLTQLRSFMGFCSYYRSFVPGFSTRAAPLNALMKKEVSFIWTHECQEAMNDLKVCLTQAPILAFPRSEAG